MGITKAKYELLKKNYGRTSSWAVWDKPLSKERNSKENVGTMEWMKNEDSLIKKLKTDFVFIAFNGSSSHDGETGHQPNTPWANFHSCYTYGRDYVLRFAILETEAEGSYITDLIKDYQTANAPDAIKQLNLNNNKAELEKHISKLTNELEILCGNKKPCLIALGRKTAHFLNKTLGKRGYDIRYLQHYSSFLNFQKYRETLKEIIQSKTDSRKRNEE